MTSTGLSGTDRSDPAVGSDEPVLSAVEVGQLYLELHHVLHRIVDTTMTAAGLSLARAKVLIQLEEHGAMNQAALAARLGFAPRSVTDTVDALEREGLAERSEDPHDRRARIVGITAAGRRALTDVLSVKHQAMEKIFGALTPRQRREFAGLLTTIKTTLQPPSGDSCV